MVQITEERNGPWAIIKDYDLKPGDIANLRLDIFVEKIEGDFVWFNDINVPVPQQFLKKLDIKFHRQQSKLEKQPMNKEDIISLMQLETRSGLQVSWDYNQFPDGQVQFKISNDYDLFDEEFNVKVSLCNPIILDLFFQMVDLCEIHNLTINYLYGARSDKDETETHHVTNVAGFILDRLSGVHYASISFLAPHCDISLWFNRSAAKFDLPSELDLSEYDLIIFPDESAKKRFSKVDMPHLICEKIRDQNTGKILEHKIPELPKDVWNVLLLDDLGDGLATFVNIAESLPEGIKTDLFIFHGVFSNNALARGLMWFNRIFVSNSLLAPEVQKSQLSTEDQNRVTIFNVW